MAQKKNHQFSYIFFFLRNKIPKKPIYWQNIKSEVPYFLGNYTKTVISYINNDFYSLAIKLV